MAVLFVNGYSLSPTFFFSTVSFYLVGAGVEVIYGKRITGYSYPPPSYIDTQT